MFVAGVTFDAAVRFAAAFTVGVATSLVAAWLGSITRKQGTYLLLALVLVIGGLFVVDRWRVDAHNAALEKEHTSLTVVLHARVANEGMWEPEVFAKPGDQIDYLLTVVNDGPGIARDVVLRVTPAGGTKYLCESAEFVNKSTPNGERIKTSRMSPNCAGASLFKTGYKLGTYWPESNVYLTWRERLPTTIKDTTELKAVGFAYVPGKTRETADQV